MSKWKGQREFPKDDAAPQPAPRIPEGKWLSLQRCRMDSGAVAFKVMQLVQNEDGTFSERMLHDVDLPSIAAGVMEREALRG